MEAARVTDSQIVSSLSEQEGAEPHWSGCILLVRARAARARDVRRGLVGGRIRPASSPSRDGPVDPFSRRCDFREKCGI